jgi:hypothetical protein
MGKSAFTPAVIAETFMQTLEDKLFAKKIANKSGQGTITKLGDRIIYPGLADVAIDAYTGSSLTYASSQSADITLPIDKQYKYSFYITDVEEAQNNQPIESALLKRAAHNMAKKIDTDLFLLYGSAAANSVAITDTSCDDDTVIGNILQLGRMLDENNVPDNERWLAIPPWVKMMLMSAGVQFQINNGITGTGGVAVAKEYGFDIFVTNNLYNSNTAAAPVHSVLAGSYDAIGYAGQIMSNESFRDPDYFRTDYRGLMTFGVKVLKPKELALATLTYAAPTI